MGMTSFFKNSILQFLSLSLCAFSAYGVNHFELKSQSEYQDSQEFDIISLNEWRDSVAESKKSEEELMLNLRSFILSTPMINFAIPQYFENTPDLLIGKWTPQELNIFLKLFNREARLVKKSFSIWLSSSAKDRRRTGVTYTIECLGRSEIKRSFDYLDCQNILGEFQPFISKEKAQAGFRSLLVIYRAGHLLDASADREAFLKSFATSNSIDKTEFLNFMTDYVYSNTTHQVGITYLRRLVSMDL